MSQVDTPLSTTDTVTSDSRFSTMDTLTSDSSTLSQPVCNISDRLETLYEPSDCIIVADVVFVHGLGGHPQETWTYKGLVESEGSVTEPEVSSFRKLFKKKKDMAEKPKKVDASQSSVYWPKDLLPKDIRNVRILTYGYGQHARPYTRHTINQAKEHGLLRQDLLMEALCTKRKTCADRPLIFVAHSFGGTLVKEALVEFYIFGRYAIFQDLTELCQAVMFFGTPHQATSNESWDLVIRNIIEAAKPESKSAILKGLDFRSSILEMNKLRAHFNALIEGERIKVCNFQEGQGTAGLKHFGGKAVPDDFSRSSDSSLEDCYTISANHMNMCRFRDSNDPGYQVFIRALVKAYPEIKLRSQETVTSEEA